MANKISYTNYGTNNLVNSTSRYSFRRIIQYGDDNKSTFTVYKDKNARIGPDDKFYEIQKEMEFRPDLVSNQFYGTPDLWWRIMEVNKMIDIMEFRSGRNIRIPNNFLM
jgi:hypothetical protein